MPKVMAFFMHEEELSAASAAMPQGEVTPSYVVGELDDAGIEALRREGLVVQPIEEREPPDWSGKVVAHRRQRGLSAAHAASAAPEVFDIPAAAPRVFVLTFDRPLLPSVRESLGRAGVALIESVGRNQYTARLSIAQKAEVDQMSFVREARPYSQEGVQPETLSEQAPDVGADSTVPDLVTYELRLHRPDDGPTVVQRLEAQGVSVEGQQERKIRFHLPRSRSSLVAQIRGLPEVYSVDEWIPPRLSNDRARVLLGIDIAGSNPGSMITQSGDGQTVAIADSGLDQTHPDIPPARVVGVVAKGRPPSDATDPHGHGTHVAGSVLGDGAASSGSIRGTAPGARLFFQSIMDAAGGLGGLPWNLNDLFDEAYQQGARIHNNSWGADSRSRYTFNSIEADEFVASHPDMLVVVAAGNEGTARQPVNSSPGSVDWLSVNSPATSKNSLTVGACQTDRQQGGYAPYTWSQLWPQDFPQPPIAAEKVSGDPQSMAAFSSRGPCDDQRIKPDVVAPGTDVVSAKASTAPLSNFWGSYPQFGGKYAYMGGTSMATPLVSGCAALVREYYAKEHQHDASAALTKATIINGTRELIGPSARADHPQLPNYHQGFGCVHLPWTLPNAGVPHMRLAFLDTWASAAPPLAATGDAVRYAVTIGDRHPFRVCLAWTDLPGRALQNNLNLFVEDPDGVKYLGNEGRRASFKAPDPDNNVEIVRIDAPASGQVVIKISATNLLSSTGQHFALVVTGDLSSGLILW